MFYSQELDIKEVVEDLRICQFMKFYDFIPSGFRDMYFQSQMSCSDEVLDRTQSWGVLETLIYLSGLSKIDKFVVLAFHICKDHGF